MRVVVDANVLGAAVLRPQGWTASQFARTDLSWLVPQQAADELRRLVQTFAFREPKRRAEFARRAKGLLAECNIVANTRLRKYARNRLVLIAEGLDPTDACYMAAVLASKADMLWTRDRALLEALPGIAVLMPPGAPAS